MSSSWIGRVAAAAAALAGSLALASGASAHTWNLENDFAASPDGVTAAANPFPDAYGDAGVWTAGYAGGGSYSTVEGVTKYSGVTSFEVAPSSQWQLIQAPGFEGWRADSGGDPFPFVANNSEPTGVFAAWPPETAIFHPGTVGTTEVPRAAVRWVSPVTGTVSIEATFADVDCGGGDGIDFSVDRQEAGSSTITNLAGRAVGYCGSGSYTSGSVSVSAGDTYYFSVGEGGGGEKDFDSTGVTVNITDGAPEPLTISAPAREAGTYNHAITPVTVSGKDTDGDTVALSASNVPSGLTFNASTGTLSGSPKVPAGEYVVTFAASDGNGETVTRRLRLTVEPASCLLTDKAASFASKSPAALTAKLTEPVTKAAIVKREVQFTAVASQTREAGTPFSALTSSTGVAKVKAPLAAGEVYLVGAYFPGDADYLPCAAPANEIVSVAPSTYVSAGAGTIAIGKAISSFGYSAVQATEGGNPLVLITPAGELSAGVITSISKPTSTSATWTGTGGWNGANAEYTATAVDPGTGADTFEITVTVEGTVVWSSEGPRAVKGGDVKVH